MRPDTAGFLAFLNAQTGSKMHEIPLPEARAMMLAMGQVAEAETGPLARMEDSESAQVSASGMGAISSTLLQLCCYQTKDTNRSYLCYYYYSFFFFFIYGNKDMIYYVFTFKEILILKNGI